jgi:hypothetical protein
MFESCQDEKNILHLPGGENSFLGRAGHVSLKGKTCQQQTSLARLLRLGSGHFLPDFFQFITPQTFYHLTLCSVGQEWAKL